MILFKDVLFVNEFKSLVSPYILYVFYICTQKSSSTLLSSKTFWRIATKSIYVLLS